MKKTTLARGLMLAAVAVATGGCNKNVPSQASPDTGGASATASASATAATASGPIIAPQASASRPTDAQREAGATLARQGGGGSVAACTTCHGANGEGNAAMSAPRLAGQSYAYLLHELQSYANDSRAHVLMGPIAKAMTAEQRAAGAAYYASVAAAPAGAPVVTSTSTGGNERGRRLAEFGDEAQHVQACSNCHGPEGMGSGADYPYLAGQHASYLTATLGAWRDGTRRNDPSGQMPVIAKALADADVQAVAAHYAALPPPTTPRDADVSAPLASAPGSSAVVSGPRGGAQSPQGVGTQQGALTGGTQGPGGTAQTPDAASGSGSAAGR